MNLPDLALGGLIGIAAYMAIVLAIDTAMASIWLAGLVRRAVRRTTDKSHR